MRATGDYFEIDVSEVQYPSYDHIGLQQYPAKEKNVALSNVKHTGMGWGAKFVDDLSSGFHDYGVLWTPTEMIFEIDGEPDWNVIAFDRKGGMPHPQKQFYALAQYTRFIRPGFQIISAGGAYNTLAAYCHASKRLVLVSTNWDAPASNDLDLTAFTGILSSAVVYRTTADEAVNLQEGRITLSPKEHLVDQLQARSITTYVIDGVSPRPNSPSSTIAGVHQIGSQGTKLCLNITCNSTDSGAGIIPYPCSGSATWCSILSIREVASTRFTPSMAPTVYAWPSRMLHGRPETGKRLAGQEI